MGAARDSQMDRAVRFVDALLCIPLLRTPGSRAAGGKRAVARGWIPLRKSQKSRQRPES